MRAIFERLMSFDTVSANPNMDLMLYVQGLLQEAGIAVRLIPDETGKKANLFATVGPEGAGVMLSGHTDVVPVEGQAWTVPPFALTEREADVLLWLTQGKTNQDIGQILGLSARTVNKHLEQVFQKMGVDNRTAAAVMADRVLWAD